MAKHYIVVTVLSAMLKTRLAARRRRSACALSGVAIENELILDAGEIPLPANITARITRWTGETTEPRDGDEIGTGLLGDRAAVILQRIAGKDVQVDVVAAIFTEIFGIT
jgi:hypothetical protein